MSDDDAFVAAIIGSPDDAVLRLVYADWLDEQGDPRGKFVRLEVEAVGRVGYPDFDALRRLALAAAPADNAAWVGAVCRLPTDEGPYVVWGDEYLFDPPPRPAPAFAVSDEELIRVRHEEERIRQRANSWWVSAYLVLLAFSLLLIVKILAFFVHNPTLLR